MKKNLKVSTLIRQRFSCNGYPKKYKQLTYLGKLTESAYPLDFLDTRISFRTYDYSGSYDLELVRLYRIIIIDNIEYIMFVTPSRGVISAYATVDNELVRVGAAAVEYCSDKKGLYIDSLVVCPEYRQKGIGTNLIHALIISEKNYLKSHSIFAYAHADTKLEKALNQDQLEHFYENNGVCIAKQTPCETVVPEKVTERLQQIIHSSFGG